jgi:hypothetical protein
MIPWLSWTGQLNPSTLQVFTKKLVHLLMSVVCLCSVHNVMQILFLLSITLTYGPEYLIRYSYLLRAGRSGDRIPVAPRFSAPVQTRPGAHQASYTMGTGSLPGVKLSRRGVNHSPPSNTAVEERVELYICSPSGSSWPVLGWTLPVPFLTASWRRFPALNYVTATFFLLV